MRNCEIGEKTIFAIFRDRNLILKVGSQFRNSHNLIFGPFKNPGPFIPRPTPYPTGLILPEENKPNAMELWKPFFDGISNFFETKKKDFIKIMGIMNGESDMVVKPAFATGKLSQTGSNGSKGTGSIQVR